MKNLFACVLALLALNVLAQNTTPASTKEINTQVWKPYIAAYKNFDTEKLMALHTKDVVRVSEDENQIFGFAEYKKKVARENQFNKNYDIKATIEFRFTKRIDGETLAHESGIFKINVLKDNNGNTATLYGRFNVVMRKENGIWKISMDADAAENNSFAERDFLGAKAME